MALTSTSTPLLLTSTLFNAAVKSWRFRAGPNWSRNIYIFLFIVLLSVSVILELGVFICPKQEKGWGLYRLCAQVCSRLWRAFFFYMILFTWRRSISVLLQLNADHRIWWRSFSSGSSSWSGGKSLRGQVQAFLSPATSSRRTLRIKCEM